MYRCPHCSQPGISAMRKMSLGPAVPATCRSCGKRVGVPYTAMLAGIPFLAAIAVAASLNTWPLRIVVVVTGFLIMSAVHMLWVPLERRE
jgi:prepilin signal peptidase PulO-like enzyme (type II secretory pathway)